VQAFAPQPETTQQAQAAVPGSSAAARAARRPALDPIIHLQHTAGNQAVARLLQEAQTSPGQPLDPVTRRFMESRIGFDMGAVRVHTDERAADQARSLGALAYTVGSHIVFDRGRYQPHSPAGAGLLAHELAHMARGHGRPPALRRKPDPARLNIEVPEVGSVQDFEPEHPYAWQNPAVREQVFPARDSALRGFLLTYKEIDLRDEFKTGLTAEVAAGIGQEIVTERKRLQEDLAEHARLRNKATADLKTAQAGTRRHLAEPEVREQQRKQRALEEQRKQLDGRARVEQGGIAELEKKGDNLKPAEERELDRRRGTLAKINAELEPTVQSLSQVKGAFEAGMAPFSTEEARLQREIKEHQAAEKEPTSELASIKGKVDKKGASYEAAVQWRLRQFRQRISGMKHDDLLELVLDEFDADPDHKRHSKQARYMMIHFSGMRYKSAHSTWGPPQELLTTLKEQQIRELFADADQGTVEREAEATEATITEELKAADVGRARKTELLAARKGLGAPAAVRTAVHAQLLAQNPQEAQAFEELEASERLRAEAVAGGDAKGAQEASQRIEQLERQIRAPQLKRIRAQLAEADRKRLNTLLNFQVKEARQAMSALTDLQALSVLQDMKASFPDWVWHEVVRRTQLRVNVTDSDEWVTRERERRTKLGVSVADLNWATPVTDKDLDLKDPVTARWRAILKGWPREPTIWNEKHGKEYEIVATAVVCNQLAEHAQKVHGKQQAQGIPGAVKWYQARAAEAAAKGATGGERSYFIRPTKAQDLVPGSTLFWAHFESNWEKAEWNMAHRLQGIDFLTEDNLVIAHGLQHNGWTYEVAANGDITRTRGEGDTAQTQWFAWQHEAYVVDQDRGKVITFETSAGARMSARTLQSLVAPMTDRYFPEAAGGHERLRRLHARGKGPAPARQVAGGHPAGPEREVAGQPLPGRAKATPGRSSD
jgi:hypothetical protein